MSQAIVSTTQEFKVTKKKQEFIFVIQLHSGTFVIGQGSNPAKRIAAINSGLHSFIKKTLQVNRVIGIKEINEQRNLPTVVAQFCNRYGENKVLVV